MLANASPEQQKQMLGERLYMLIVPTQSQLAGKITGMFLEGLDHQELQAMLANTAELTDKIADACVVLKEAGDISDACDRAREARQATA